MECKRMLPRPVYVRSFNPQVIFSDHRPRVDAFECSAPATPPAPSIPSENASTKKFRVRCAIQSLCTAGTWMFTCESTLARSCTSVRNASNASLAKQTWSDTVFCTLVFDPSGARNVQCPFPERHTCRPTKKTGFTFRILSVLIFFFGFFLLFASNVGFLATSPMINSLPEKPHQCPHYLCS